MPTGPGSDDDGAPDWYPPNAFAEEAWCKRCGTYKARRSDKFICPVCRDDLAKAEARAHERAMRRKAVQDG